MILPKKILIEGKEFNLLFCNKDGAARYHNYSPGINLKKIKNLNKKLLTEEELKEGKQGIIRAKYSANLFMINFSDKNNMWTNLDFYNALDNNKYKEWMKLQEQIY